MIYVGIDPGIGGAIAVIKPPPLYIGAPEAHHQVEFFDTPTVQVKSGKSMKNFIDANAAALMLQAIHPDYVIIEKVQAMPGGGERSMGATSAFNFGMGYGVWLGILAALQIPFEKVHPATWKAALMGGMTKEKDSSRIRAMELYPNTAKDLNLKKHHGRADALLLAIWGKRTNHYP